jgi:hypothetical protein
MDVLIYFSVQKNTIIVAIDSIFFWDMNRQIIEDPCFTYYSFYRYGKGTGFPSQCGLHIEKGEKIKVVVTELPDNPGMSICNAMEDLFCQVCDRFELNPDQVEWYEDWSAYNQALKHDSIKTPDYHRVEFSLNNDRPTNIRWKWIDTIKSCMEE